MNKRFKLVAIILVALTVAGVLAGCNVKAGQEAGIISDAVAATKAAGFNVKFDVEVSTLVLYPGKQLEKYTKEADEAKKTPYCFSDDPVVNREMGINRTNWEDEDSTEWVTYTYSYVLVYSGGYGGSANLKKPQEKDPVSGEAVEGSTETTEPYGDLSWLEDVFAFSVASTDTSYVEYTGVKRIGKSIIRAEITRILLDDGSYAVVQQDGTFVKADGTVLKKAGSEEYAFTEGIEQLVIDRVDYTVSDGKIESIEFYSETIGYKECDQRNYLKSGRIYTAYKAMIVGRTHAIINF